MAVRSAGESGAAPTLGVVLVPAHGPGRAMSQRSRIASLDGLRAVSIMLVLFGHLTGTRGFPVPHATTRLFELSEIGVRVFFVISGFLITVALVASTRLGMEHRFEMAADAIAMGCLLAGLEGWLGRRPLYRRLLTSPLFLLVPALVIAISTLPEHPRLAHVLGTLMNAGVAVCIHRCVRQPADGVGRLLNSRPLVWIGVMSYSIYLWQQIFLNRSSPVPLCAFPLHLALVFGAAALSYGLIERPALTWRARLESRLFAPPRRRPVAAPAVAHGLPAALPVRSFTAA